MSNAPSTRPVLRVSYDAHEDFLLALVFGETIDGQLDDEIEPFAQLPDDETGELEEAGWFYRGGRAAR